MQLICALQPFSCLIWNAPFPFYYRWLLGLPDLWLDESWQIPAYDGKLQFMITWWPIARSSVFIRTHYHCGNYFSKHVWFFTNNGTILHQNPNGVHDDSPLMTCHNYTWHLFLPQTAPMLHFSQSCGPNSRASWTKPGMLQNNFLLLSPLKGGIFSCHSINGRSCKPMRCIICFCKPQKPTGHSASFFMEGDVRCNDLSFFLWRGYHEMSKTNEPLNSLLMWWAT